MKHAITIVFGIAIAVAISMLIWPNSTAQAQSGCKSFQAIGHAVLPSGTPLGLTMPDGSSGDEWGGPAYAVLGSEFLVGVMSGNDGSYPPHPHVGQGRGGSYTLGFNCIPPGQPGNSTPYYLCADTLTYAVPNAVWPVTLVDPSASIGFGHYIGNSAKIAGGTGRFQGASGNLNASGPFIFGPAFPVGRFSADISGNVCGVN